MDSTPAFPRHRFFIATPLHVGDHVTIDALAPQLFAVLRLAPGAAITLLDNSGWEFLCTIDSLDRRHASAWVTAGRVCGAEPVPALTLMQCTLKQDKFEWVLQKATELGVTRIVPVVAERSVVRPAQALAGKYERWQVIVREAAEQCGRGRVPELAPALDWSQAVTQRLGVGLLPWEEAGPANHIGAAVYGLAADAAVSLLIGPEGGLTAAEVAVAEVQGWQVVSLGPRILRAETAALAALALVQLEARS